MALAPGLRTTLIDASRRGLVGVLLAGFGLAASLPAASPLAAQPGRDQAAREPRSAQQPGQRAIERRIEARVNQLIRTQLGLNDEQVRQLQGVSARVENQRRALERDMMTTRSELRRQLLDSAPPDEPRIAELLEQLPRLERRRIDMLEQQQRELARFLTPSQRARYFALEENLRRNLQESQRRRLDGPPPDRSPGGAGAPRGGGRGPQRPPLRPPARPPAP
jgi:Spy/CpxP family protein refolding chaperone